MRKNFNPITEILSTKTKILVVSRACLPIRTQNGGEASSWRPRPAGLTGLVL